MGQPSTRNVRLYERKTTNLPCRWYTSLMLYVPSIALCSDMVTQLLRMPACRSFTLKFVGKPLDIQAGLEKPSPGEGPGDRSPLLKRGGSPCPCDHLWLVILMLR